MKSSYLLMWMDQMSNIGQNWQYQIYYETNILLIILIIKIKI